MNQTLLIIGLLIAVTDWMAVGKKWKPIEIITKPATMIALIAWLLTNGALRGGMGWIVVGAVFCLVGDVFLLWPERFFLFGLVAFLLGHVGYILGLNQTLPPFGWITILAILVLSLQLWRVYRQMAAGLTVKGQPKMKLPVLVYSIVISLMVFSALLTLDREEWTLLTALLVSVGAMLFYLSDTMIGLDRFVKPISNARLKIMITYHMGQVGILLGTALHFLG